MAFVKVIALFDHRTGAEQAREALLRNGLVQASDLAVLPAQDETDRESPRSLWERLKQWLRGQPNERDVDAYAEGVRRGGVLLVAEVPEERVDPALEVLRRHGAVDLKRRVRRWAASGWNGYEPMGFAFTEEDIEEEHRCINAETDEESDDPKEDRYRTVRLFDDATGREIGRITEAELKVLQNALEEEDPDDNDYWINRETLETLACWPGATAHLIRLLRDALRGHPDGIDLDFQCEEQQRQSLRPGRAVPARQPH